MSVDVRAQVLLTDFPWSYRNKKTGGTHKSGASQHYDTMSLEEIKDFPIHDIIGENSIHFMWVPVPLKFEAVEVVNHWKDFTYKTSIIWKKVDGIGMGFWARGVIEELWLLTKGKVKALRWQGKNILEESNYEGWFPSGWIQSKSGKIHSRKPEKAIQMIEEMTTPFPALQKKVELFATKSREGWTSVGWEIGSDVYEFAKHLKSHDEQFNVCSLCGWSLPHNKSLRDKCKEGECVEDLKSNTIHDPYRARLEGKLKPFKVAA